VYNKLHKTQRPPSAFKPYDCWGRASRSAPAYPGKSAICYEHRKNQPIVNTPQKAYIRAVKFFEKLGFLMFKCRAILFTF
jgi:hypothetical protein